MLLQLWVSPVKLVVGKGNLLSQIYRLLGLHGRFGSRGHHHSQPWLSGSSSGSSTAAAAAKEEAAASAEDGSAVKGVEVWSGPLRVTLEGPGKFRTDRVDMILGGLRRVDFDSRLSLHSAAPVRHQHAACVGDSLTSTALCCCRLLCSPQHHVGRRCC